MASVDVKKLNSSTSGGSIRHAFRTEDDHAKIHSNKEINQELTKDNYFIGCNSRQEVQERLKNRIKEVDKLIPPKRLKKDRVTALSMVTYCPKDIPQDRQKEFFELAHKTLAEYFGGEENLGGSAVHVDEIHEYLKKTGDCSARKQTSLAHMHTVAVPYSAEHGINASKLVTREWLRNISTVMDRAVYERFGVHYVQREENAVGVHDNRSINDLKIDSFKELLNQYKGLSNQYKGLSNQYEELEQAIKRRKDELQELPEPNPNYLKNETLYRLYYKAQKLNPSNLEKLRQEADSLYSQEKQHRQEKQITSYFDKDRFR